MLGVSAIVAAAALMVGAVAALRRTQGSEQGAYDIRSVRSNVDNLRDQLAELRSDLAEMGTVVAGLPSLWETERQRVEDANERAKGRLAAARAAESRARAAKRGEGDEDGDDLAEEAAQLLAEHAQVGDREGVHAVHGDVESDATDDLTQRALQAGWSPYL